MELHSQTERALFHRDYVNRLLDLAGVDEPLEEREFVSWRYHDMEPYLVAARGNNPNLG